MATHVMPIRGERSAPTFDEKKPKDLARYFDQLKTLFARCQIATDADKKRYAVSFLESDVADSWEALPEYTQAATTFDQFKLKLFEIYNQVGLRYVMADLDRLIGERQRIGMRSLQDLTEFHLRFNAIASYLITSQLLSAREQSQMYLRVFGESIHSQVTMRLQISQPNHHPGLPYQIEDIYNAAKWVLQGIPSTLSMQSTPSTTTSTAPLVGPDQGFIKPEQLTTFLSDLAKTIVETVVATNNRGRPLATNGPPSSTNGGPRNQKCNFDGCDRFIRDCPAVTEYIKQGRCRRNFEGKVILPSGAFVPRDIPGQYLRDRIDEWHKRNPNQLANGTLFNAVVSSTQPTIPTIKEQPDVSPTYQLSAQDRIAALEAELFNLKVRHQPKFVPTIKTRRQRAAEEETDTNQADPQQESRTTQAPRPPPARSAPIHTRVPEAQQQRQSTPTPAPEHNSTAPEHPFRNAKEAIYVPPQSRNVGVPVKIPAQTNTKRFDPAYRTAPAIHDLKIANNVYQRALETPLTITYHELLSLAPEVRAQVREAITSKRVPTKEPTPSNVYQDTDLTPEELSYLMPDEIPVSFDTDPTPIMALSSTSASTPTSRGIIIDDPIEQYYRTLKPGESPDPDAIVVAKESLALRSISPLINNHMKVESILDPGCQIVAMSEDVCHELVLPYDPSIILNMQSANGTIDPSLGLARNVPFLIGDLTFYMQVHVIRNPAYDILLGRPFDVLTESVVRNFKNEDQTITIHDPNSERVVTIPTTPRGPPRILNSKGAVFRR